MVVISRRIPQSNIAIKKALNKGLLTQTSLPPAHRFLSPQFDLTLNDGTDIYNQTYNTANTALANYGENNLLLAPAVEILRTYVSHFIQVLNLAIVRGDEGFVYSDLNFYSLSDSKVPNLDTEDSVFFWAKNIVDGEAARLAAKPLAPPMTNPTLPKFSVHYNAALAILGQETTLAGMLAAKRADLNNAFEPAKLIVTQLWNLVETNYLALPDSARRDMMREWGVVFVSEGAPAIITGLVKSGTGAPKVGATVTLEETGATTTTNADGRYNLPSTFIGTGDLIYTFPGEPDVTIPVTLTEENEGQNVNMPDVVIG